jgi:two-component system, cell cycle sensor histidine kinase and response regulator CckA
MNRYSHQFDSLESPPTILLVEDEPQVRKWIHHQLEQKGYNLLEACDGMDALLIAELHNGPIHVLVTDVVMPRLNGPALVASLLQLRPDVRTLYISGYPAPFLECEASLPHESDYLQKPFSAEDLLERIETVLEEAAPPNVNGSNAGCEASD